MREARADGFAAHAVGVLSEPLDWLELVRGRLEEMTADALVSGTRRIFVPGVEPKTFLLHDEPGRRVSWSGRAAWRTSPLLGALSRSPRRSLTACVTSPADRRHILILRRHGVPLCDRLLSES